MKFGAVVSNWPIRKCVKFGEGAPIIDPVIGNIVESRFFDTLCHNNK